MVPAAVEAVASSIQALVYALALAIQAGVDELAARLQARGLVWVPAPSGPVRAPVELRFDTVALDIMTLFNAVSTAIQSAVDAVTDIARGSRACNAQQQAGKQQPGKSQPGA